MGDGDGFQNCLIPTILLSIEALSKETAISGLDSKNDWCSWPVVFKEGESIRPR